MMFGRAGRREKRVLRERGPLGVLSGRLFQRREGGEMGRRFRDPKVPVDGLVMEERRRTGMMGGG